MYTANAGDVKCKARSEVILEKHNEHRTNWIANHPVFDEQTKATETLFPPEEVTLCLNHLDNIVENKRKGAAKAEKRHKAKRDAARQATIHPIEIICAIFSN